ncbi:hypothetical protein BpHYR1_000385 [Brachionus plicatilis]|uniref:Uncharacterized protein n=1 Tax=Brachionus plicatilis TaxID=10195 RepID=A0A3M7Q5J0_BRAPC|nr:hypothetical protein BpHYR1_000385 [Brachionus plicatilis]
MAMFNQPKKNKQKEIWTPDLSGSLNIFAETGFDSFLLLHKVNHFKEFDFEYFHFIVQCYKFLYLKWIIKK